MPSITRQQVAVFPSPDLGDLIFWEQESLSREKYLELDTSADHAYGTAHHDPDEYPDHKLVYWEADPDYEFGRDGQDYRRVRKYYAADRQDQDKYNFEFTAADIGGQKFDAVRRTYITPRADWSETTPAAGSIMSTEPSGKFAGDYVLASRQQTRTGQKQLDSLYVTEVRTYVRKVTISGTKLDPQTNGVIGLSTTLYYRGEDYNGSPIETAAADDSNWGLTSSGVNVEVEQLSEDWWAVQRQDVIPQGLGDSSYGKLLRTYTTWKNFSWPAVVSASSLDFQSISRKNGSSTTTVRVVPDREAYSGPTKFTISQHWSPNAQVLSDPVVFDVKSGRYSGAQYAVSVSRVLVNGDIQLIDNIGTQDPVFDGPNTYGENPWLTSSTQNDWPASGSLIDIQQEPFRGGYLITEQRADRPY